MIKRIITTVALTVFPLLARAATFQELVATFVSGVITPLVLVLLALALVVFFWGIVQYLRLEGGSDEKKEQARKIMLWGIVGLFVMTAVWGLVNLVTNTFFEPEDLASPPSPEF